MNSGVSRVPAVTSIVFLAFAVLGSWPYGFYTLLRLVVCGSAVYLAVQFNSRSDGVWIWVMAGVALLFNPVVPVGLTRDTWVLLDVATAVVFGFAGRKLGPRRAPGSP